MMRTDRSLGPQNRRFVRERFPLTLAVVFSVVLSASYVRAQTTPSPAPEAPSLSNGGNIIPPPGDLKPANISPVPAPTATPMPAGGGKDDLLIEEKPKDDDLLHPDTTSSPGGDDLLTVEPGSLPGATPTPPEQLLPPPKKPPTVELDPHRELYAKNNFPSASQCAACHQQIYDEWRSSNHAYASISPVFHKFEQKLTDLSQGTVGYFCMRCHAGVGTSMNEKRDEPLWKRAAVSREGVTCITCHRVDEEYTKVNGDRRIVQGDIYQPMYGSRSGAGVAKVVKNKDTYHVKTSDDEPGPGIAIHKKGIEFKPITTSEFCVSCHQVAVHPGIKLEVVWEQFRSSPSLSQGTQCQECHMGRVPGKAKGYVTGTAAVVGGVPINPGRKHANHNFYGPGYPTAHPGIFPHNPKAGQFAIESWLKFDYRAGWGTDAFENKLSKNSKYKFPDVWSSADDRYTARQIVTENLAMLQQKRKLREKVMENGSHVDGPFFKSDPAVGKTLKFNYKITNTNPGHNMPSGSLGAQPEIWVNVALINPRGKTIWETGYTDSYGDMCDLHSRDVRTGKIADDRQLVNLQTKFLTTNVKGTDREMYLPVNFDIDQIPFIRPSGVPTSVLNHPPFIRMEQRSIPPLSSRDAKYSVPGKLLKEPGKYRLTIRLRSRAEPIYFMDFIEATKEMDRAMNEWMIDIHPYAVEFEVR
ncbi:MAG: multiheme c-type cytochrome [Chthoniobacterales bacterium]